MEKLRKNFLTVFVLLCTSTICTPLLAAEEHEEGYGIVMTLSPAWEREITKGVTKTGVAATMEFTLIDDWLEIELGANKLGNGLNAERSLEVIFKKPFHLSAKSEFAIGVGMFQTKFQTGTTGYGFQTIVEYIYWKEKNYGWFIEPSYSRMRHTNEKSFGISSGLIVRF